MSFGLEFDFQDTAGSKVGCILEMDMPILHQTISYLVQPILLMFVSNENNVLGTTDSKIDCMLKHELDLETLPETELYKTHWDSDLHSLYLIITILLEISVFYSLKT